MTKRLLWFILLLILCLQPQWATASWRSALNRVASSTTHYVGRAAAGTKDYVARGVHVVSQATHDIVAEALADDPPSAREQPNKAKTTTTQTKKLHSDKVQAKNTLNTRNTHTQREKGDLRPLDGSIDAEEYSFNDPQPTPTQEVWWKSIFDFFAMIPSHFVGMCYIITFILIGICIHRYCAIHQKNQRKAQLEYQRLLYQNQQLLLQYQQQQQQQPQYPSSPPLIPYQPLITPHNSQFFAQSQPLLPYQNQFHPPLYQQPPPLLPQHPYLPANPPAPPAAIHHHPQLVEPTSDANLTPPHLMSQQFVSNSDIHSTQPSPFSVPPPPSSLPTATTSLPPPTQPPTSSSTSTSGQNPVPSPSHSAFPQSSVSQPTVTASLNTATTPHSASPSSSVPVPPNAWRVPAPPGSTLPPNQPVVSITSTYGDHLATHSDVSSPVHSPPQVTPSQYSTVVGFLSQNIGSFLRIILFILVMIFLYALYHDMMLTYTRLDLKQSTQGMRIANERPSYCDSDGQVSNRELFWFHTMGFVDPANACTAWLEEKTTIEQPILLLSVLIELPSILFNQMSQNLIEIMTSFGNVKWSQLPGLVTGSVILSILALSVIPTLGLAFWCAFGSDKQNCWMRCCPCIFCCCARQNDNACSKCAYCCVSLCSRTSEACCEFCLLGNQNDNSESIFPQPQQQHLLQHHQEQYQYQQQYQQYQQQVYQYYQQQQQQPQPWQFQSTPTSTSAPYYPPYIAYSHPTQQMQGPPAQNLPPDITSQQQPSQSQQHEQPSQTQQNEQTSQPQQNEQPQQHEQPPQPQQHEQPSQTQQNEQPSQPQQHEQPPQPQQHEQPSQPQHISADCPSQQAEPSNVLSSASKSTSDAYIDNADIVGDPETPPRLNAESSLCEIPENSPDSPQPCDDKSSLILVVTANNQSEAPAPAPDPAPAPAPVPLEPMITHQIDQNTTEQPPSEKINKTVQGN